MVRKQVFIAAELNRRLKAHATAYPMPRSSAVASSMCWSKLPFRVGEGNWKDAWRQAAGMWADFDEIDEIIAARRKRNRQRRERLRKQMQGRSSQ